MRAPALGLSYKVWQQLARLAGADHLHASGLGSKFYETDDEVAAHVRSLLDPLRDHPGPAPPLPPRAPSPRHPPPRPGRTPPPPHPPTQRCAPPTCSCSPVAVSPRTPTDPPP